MGASRQLSVKTSIRLTLFVSLFSVIVTGFVLHELLRRRAADGADNATAVMLAQMAATQLRADVSQERRDLNLACGRLVDHPAVLAVRLWDPCGAPIAGAAEADEMLSLLDSPRHATEPGVVVESIKLPAHLAIDGASTRRVEMDLGFHVREESSARMALLLRDAATSQGGLSHLWLFCVPLAAVGVAAYAFGSRRLGRQVVRPISSLIEIVTNRIPGSGRAGSLAIDGGADCPTGRQDELGQLAQSLVELRQDVRTWRHRAETVERRMDSQIAAETQRITRDLRRVQRDAWQDPLTGVNNRRMLDEKLPEIFAAQRDARQDLSVVLFDLDHFKMLNDTLGHAAGDEVLAFVGELLRQCLRADDIAVRYGGDEFVLILPGLSAQKALATANRIRALFAQRAKMMVKVRPSPTISAGVASLMSTWPTDHVKLIELADKALYKAKQATKTNAQEHQHSV